MEEANNQNNENKWNWSGIPTHYKSKIDEINDEVIKNIYSKFLFKYYEFNVNQNCKNNEEGFVSFVFNYLIRYKFIIFHLTKEGINYNSNSISNIPSIVNCVFCVEEECIIIEKVNETILDKILLKLKETQISLINVGKNNKLFQVDDISNEEIEKFCDHFQKTIKQNIVVKMTIDSIVGYLIRRYYFQSSYFNDPNFFYFDQDSLIELETKKKN